MRYALLIAAFLGLTQPAAADGAWIVAPAPQGGGSIGYVPTSIAPAKTANHKLITTMVYATAAQNFAGKQANFLMARVEFDCPAKKAQTIALQAFDADSKQVGSILKSAGFNAVDGDPWMSFVEPIACDGQTPQGNVPASDQSDAMQKMKAHG
ncbi:MAG: hypothetical protein WDM89_10235 [Rhizomicrobium sp.]